MEPNVTRREFVAAGVPAVGFVCLAAAIPLVSLGCGVPAEQELNERLLESLRALLGDLPADGSIAAAAGMDPTEASTTLRAKLSDRHLYALTWNRRFLRAFVASRRDQDLRAGRMRFVDGWLMAETEVAIAVLLGF